MSGINIRAAWAQLSDQSRCTALMLALVALWVFGALIMASIYPDASTDSKNAASAYFRHAARNGSMFLYVCALIWLIKFMRDVRGVSMSAHVRSAVTNNPLALPKLFGKIAIALSGFALFIFSYSTVKTRIPEIIPYAFDETFMSWDRALFFGHDPWTVFAWIYEIPTLIYAMDFIYDIWAVLLVGIWTLCFILTKPAAAARFRFPLALMLTWFIGGNIAAIFMSSAGPCYYGAVTELADPYAVQMAILSDLSTHSFLRAVTYQDMLWEVYESPSLGLGGISAMPSMHCATSFLFVLLAWKHKVLRYAALVFFIFILISSVVLAWHYLVDGLVAVPIAGAAWWMAGQGLKSVLKEPLK